MAGLDTIGSVSKRGVATGQPYSKVHMYSVELSHPLLTAYGTKYGVHGVHLLASTMVTSIYRSDAATQIPIGLL